MKLLQRKYTWVTATIILAIGYFVSCTKDDQVLDTASVVINSSTDLVAAKTSTPPSIDGTIDAMWTNSPELQFSTAVPEVTGDVFRGYTGNIIPWVKIKAAYDNDNIYFLVQWADPTKSLSRSPWYFDAVTKRWAQESGTYGFTSSPYRPAFYEDKLAFLWNINNSVSGWNSATCYKSCHIGLPAADGSSRHYTNFPTEKIDMWHWKSVRGGVNAGNQIHDQFQDNTYPNGRKADPGVDVYQNNVQTLTQPGVGSVSVPKYIIPGRNDYGWIMNSEVTAGTAKLIMAIDANGVLTLSDATTIDPNIGTDYQRIGSYGSGGIGAKAIPGLTLNDSYTGSMGDIPCKAVWANGSWTMEFKRLLKTSDAVNDADFSSLADQYFGFAIFENSQIAHSIKANLVLKFRK